MERLDEVKRILDSVHGQIKIPKKWCELVVDTPEFQRLRRIEQNSCRSVFPSARHDRFIHSLGVYHIGSLIVDHLAKEYHGVLPAECDKTFNTYRLACLLHDVGHTPFSHTFEEFFDVMPMLKEINAELKDKSFAEDLEAYSDKWAEHEVLSAWLSLKRYRTDFGDDDVSWPLLVRMIIGLRYKGGKDVPDKHEFGNVMIELIHGSIDADGLDYICRDVWAGGYNNFSIDLIRLIEAIQITKDDDGYHLAFSEKALNELEGVLNVKNFQYLYVINHHKVLLEQHYLKEGMKTVASYHYTAETRDAALRQLCNHEAYVTPQSLESSRYRFYRPCDDDFIALMKQTKGDEYVDSWFSRRYRLIPLWKTKMEFFNVFQEEFYLAYKMDDIANKKPSESDVKETKEDNDTNNDLGNKYYLGTIASIGEDACKKYVMTKFGLSETDIHQEQIKPKVRRLDPETIMVGFRDGLRPLSELHYSGFSVIGDESPFCFWYVDLAKITGKSIDEKRAAVIDLIKDYLKNNLQPS